MERPDWFLWHFRRLGFVFAPFMAVLPNKVTAQISINVEHFFTSSTEFKDFNFYGFISRVLRYNQNISQYKRQSKGTIQKQMAKWHLTMWDAVNPCNYWELTTFKSVIFRLTEALFRLTGVTMFRHFAISCLRPPHPLIFTQTNEILENRDVQPFSFIIYIFLLDTHLCLHKSRIANFTELNLNDPN